MGPSKGIPANRRWMISRALSSTPTCRQRGPSHVLTRINQLQQNIVWGQKGNFADLAGNVKAAFNDEFVTPSGRVGPNTQTAYVLALHFDLLPEVTRLLAVARLVEEIRQGQYHVTTGATGSIRWWRG